MILKNVSKGDPITATWANSLINKINHNGDLDLRGGVTLPPQYKKPVRLQYDEAWKIRLDEDMIYRLNSGQIYINNNLIHGESINFLPNYNSVQGYSDNSSYIPTSSNDIPIWAIDIYKSEETDTYTAYLTVWGCNEEEPEITEITDNEHIKRLYLNTVNTYQENEVEHKELKQLYSGTIYLMTNQDGDIITITSYIEGDGIDFSRIDTDVIRISADISAISSDNFLSVNQYTTNDGTIIIDLNGNQVPFPSLIADDGIIINPINNEIHVGLNMSFIGEDGITVNETTETNGQRTVTIGQSTPESLTIEQVTDPLPEEDVDDWKITMYLPMIYVQDNLFSFKQLMRIRDGKLQVSAQAYQMIGGDGQWHSALDSNITQNLQE